MAKILIVEDDPDIRFLVGTLVGEQGHDVVGFGDGESGLAAVLSIPADVLILDLMLPGMTGFDVLAALDGEARGNLRVLVLTARGSENDWERCYALGADLYLTKPFTPEELLDGVNTLLETGARALAERRERERDRAHLLSQLEAMFGE